MSATTKSKTPIRAAAKSTIKQQTTKEGMQKQLRMQQQTIDNLKRENEELRQKYEFESRIPPGTKPRSVEFEELQKLEQDGYRTQREIEEEKATNEQLKDEINMLQRRVHDKRVEVKGVFSTRENDKKLEVETKILENRLDNTLQKFNDAVAENKALRAKIDSMRCERVVFDGVHRKMERMLFEKKKEMADIIEESNVCYEDRNASEQEKKNIQEQQRTERQKFEAEAQALDQEIAKGDELPDYFRVMNKEEEEGNAGERAFGDGGYYDGFDGGVGQQQQQLTPQEQAVAQLSAEKAQAYEEALWRIKSATGIDSIAELAQRYVETEEQIVTNNNIIGDLEVQIQRLEKEEREDREKAAELRLHAEESSAERARLQEDTQRQIEQTQQRTAQFKEKEAEVYERISLIYQPVKRLFEAARCDAPEDANAENDVTQTNVVSYLGQIEQKANDLRARFLEANPQLLGIASQTRSRIGSPQDLGLLTEGTTPIVQKVASKNNRPISPSG
ncbi:MAG: putative flagellar outer dynein arm-docking complex protein 1 [Streblomastix strix]|uniref:Putative flagellar outer dynein arm-docking complex protein 1 n=1 Tax=Streblomastix strix TaxID=222440 RepID=A0A5J4VBY0_9EUKA|nr:MAG: putative flagellar outer dynein arm-docking complex protein 1 [Streblomastix strix]